MFIFLIFYNPISINILTIKFSKLAVRHEDVNCYQKRQYLVAKPSQVLEASVRADDNG